MKKEYPKWKLVLWRFVRVFFVAFLVSFAANVQAIKIIGLSGEALFDTMIIPACIAGLVALFKALRVYFGKKYPGLLKLVW